MGLLRELFGIAKGTYHLTKETISLVNEGLEVTNKGLESLNNSIKASQQQWVKEKPLRDFEELFISFKKKTEFIKNLDYISKNGDILLVFFDKGSDSYIKEQKQLEENKITLEEEKKELIWLELKIKHQASLWFGNAVKGLSIKEIEQYYWKRRYELAKTLK